MASVVDLVEPSELAVRAGEYLQRAGEVLRASGRVRIVELGPQRVTASVEDAGTRTVVLVAEASELQATCDCGAPASSGLCPHVVAVAAEAWYRAPNRP
jgi:uncharacterized Zn finger protein